MKTPATPLESNDRLTLGLKWSVTLHLLLFLSIFLNEWLFPGNLKNYVPTIRVDLVGLPDVLKKDLHLPSQSKLNSEIRKILKDAEQSANRIKTKQQEVASKTEEKAQKNEMVVQSKVHKELEEQSTEGIHSIEKRNRRALRKQVALETIRNSLIQEEEEIENSNEKPLLGNKISKGSSLAGEDIENAQMNYIDEIHSRLKENFELPRWLKSLPLQARVSIQIDHEGRVAKLIFKKTSGNTQFDDEVKRAIKSSEPFPAPPESISHALLRDGIALGFPL